jgi:transcriptional regulator with XRE-family HTH domain
MANMNNNIGYKIKILREQHGVTQQDLAYKLKKELGNMTIATLSRYENGHRSAPTKVLEKIAEMFALEANYFFDYSIDGDDVPEIQSREYIVGSLITDLINAPYEILVDIKKYASIMLFKDKLEKESETEV